MTAPQATRPAYSPIRVWPGILAASIQLLAIVVVPLVAPQFGFLAILGGLAGALVILVWWLAASRAPWIDRLATVVFMAATVALVSQLIDPTIARGGQGRAFYIYAVEFSTFGLAAGVFLARRMSRTSWRVTVAAAILVACGALAVLRVNGVTGDGRSQFAWRWTKTAEQRLLARADLEPAPAAVTSAPATSAAATVNPPTTVVANVRSASPEARPAAAIVNRQIQPDWPGFRGFGRDGVVTGVRIKTDWRESPPVELWRRAVGPGWSSFAVGGGLLYTQEQRGDVEVVACYDESSGKPVWTHRDNARFWDSEGGPGPRGTPTLDGGRLFSMGATGIVNALDAATGAVLWTHNAATDTGAPTPGWGFSGSPIIVRDVGGDLLIVAASGRLAAYDAATGKLRWKYKTGSGTYASPQLVTIDGVPQVVLLNGDGAISVLPADGSVLWKHSWPGATILQPVPTVNGGLLITTGGMSGGLGTRRLSITHGSNTWKADEVWTSAGLKPWFNDMVIHEGFAYGFDGSILSCIDLKDGSRKWKGGRYGHGQMLVLRDQSLLLILSEDGELALVPAVPSQFSELARFRAMEGKTWNHPVLTRQGILVRNSEEMVAFRF